MNTTPGTPFPEAPNYTTSPDEVTAGRRIGYTLRVVNGGPSTAENVTLLDRLPPGIVVVAADTPDGGSCDTGTPGEPLELPGVNNTVFLRTALNAIRTARGEAELDAVAFLKLLREKLKVVHMGEDLLKRSVNAGFSGGEKKRNEIFQMALLEPQLAILDETDSGLDIDALRVVADGVNALRSPERAMVVVTHYQRLLDYIEPDFVHVLAGGRIVRSGDKSLALELEEKGYGWIGGEEAA